MTDKRIIDNQRYNAERRAQAELMKRDLDLDQVLAKIYQEGYDRMQAQIDQFYMSYAGQNGLTKQEAMKRVSEFDVIKFNQKAAEAVRTKDFSPGTNAWLKTYNLKMRVSRLELLKAELGLEIQNLTAEANEVFDKARRDEQLAEFKRQAGILGNSARGSKKRLEAILDADFYGQKFSGRVWGETGLRAALQRDVFGSLNRIYTDMRGFKSERDRLAKKFQTSKHNAQRLLKTEISRIVSQTGLAMLNNNNFTHIIYVAEPGACDLCGPLDKIAIPISEAKMGVNIGPMHPNCKCSFYGQILMEKKDGSTNLDSYEIWNSKSLEKDKEKAYNQGMDRNKDPNKRRPISKIKQKELTKSFRDSGGYIWQDDDATLYLKNRGADACCLGSDLIVLQEKPLISEVLEELYHAEQFKNGLITEEPITQILAEIDAQKYLLSVAEKYGIPKTETEQTKKALASYQEQLKELKRYEK